MYALLRFSTLLSIAAFTLDAAAQSAGSSAAESRQTTTTTTSETQTVNATTPAPDALVMSSGSVLVIRGSKQAERLAADMRLGDGSVVTPGGTVRRADGTEVRLADGQAISYEGKIGTAPKGVATDTATVETTTVRP